MARWNSQTTHTDISEFSDNPELRRELKIWRLKIYAAVISVLVVLGLAAKPAYQAFKEHRVQQNLAAAGSAAHQEDWGEARDKARAVLLVRPDLDAYRIWTRALGKLGAPSTYMAVSEIFTHSRATREDLLETLQVMVLQAPQALALSAYASLPAQFRDQPAFRAAMVPLLIQRGQLDVAEKTLRETGPTCDDPGVRLALLRVLCSRPNAYRVAEARQIFADLVVDKADRQALEALLLLGDVAGGLAPGVPLPDLPVWLKHQSKATACHHLLAMNPAIEARPETADALYQEAISRFLANDPGELGTWLISHGKAALAASTLETTAKTHGNACLARLRALLLLNQIPEIMIALTALPSSCDLVEIEIFRANLATQNGDLITAESAWTRALNSAVFDASRNRFIEIAHAAEVSGAKNAADNAWVAAICSGWGQLPLYGDLRPVFASLIAKGRSQDLLSMFRMLLRFEPLNAELQNNAYYFGLIQGVLPPNKVADAQQILIQRVDKPVYHSTLMLAEMLDARPADALTRLPGFQHSKDVAPMMCTALEGTARVLAGETAAGTALLQKVDWLVFMRQERIVFRDLLVQLKIAGLPLPEIKTEVAETAPDQTPAWRKAVARLEKDGATDVLPALPSPKIPGANSPRRTTAPP